MKQLQRSPEQEYKKNAYKASEKYTGVYFYAYWGGKYTHWIARIDGAMGRINCGAHDTEKQAAIARDLAIIKHQLKKPLQVLKLKSK